MGATYNALMNLCKTRKSINLFNCISSNDYNTLHDILDIIDKDMCSNLFNNDNYTALMLASKLNYYDIVELLLKNDVNPNVVNDKDETALHLATREGHDDIVYLLLKNGADVNCLDKSSKTPIEYAIEGNFIDVVVELCKYDVKLNSIKLNNLTNNEIRETIESFLLNDDNESSLLQKEPSNVSPVPSQ